MSDDDPIRRRADEIRADQAAKEAAEAGRDKDLRSERLLFVQRFLDALSEKTAHCVECVEADEQPHGAVARFHFLRDGKVFVQELFEFGIDRIDGEPGNRSFLYYLEPSSVAFSIPNPATGVARKLGNADQGVVHTYAVEIAIEVMAQTVASGGVLGNAHQLQMNIKDQEAAAARRETRARAARSRKFWSGCLKGVAAFFGVVVAIGLLGNILRACAGA